MTELECLSLMELVDLRSGDPDAAAAAHLARCPRCQALLAELPADIRLPALPPAAFTPQATRAPQPRPERIRTGQLWRAASDDPDWSWVVAIIGRAPDAPEHLLVAPVSEDAQLATDRDLVLDPTTLGYNSFIDISNLGVLLEEQLQEPIATLPRPTAEGLVALYRSTLGALEPPAEVHVGLPVRDRADPRPLAAGGRAEALRALWRPADAEVTDDASLAIVEDEAARAHEDEPQGTVATLLAQRLSGAEAEWDRSTLLETSGIEGSHLDAFLDDRLDLTDKRDLDDLAGVLHTLEVPWEEAQPAVHLTLISGQGGRRESSGPGMPLAARSRPGTSEQDVTDQLYADQSTVDHSEQARAAEIDSYLAELRRRLEDLG